MRSSIPLSTRPKGRSFHETAPIESQGRGLSRDIRFSTAGRGALNVFIYSYLQELSGVHVDPDVEARELQRADAGKAPGQCFA